MGIIRIMEIWKMCCATHTPQLLQKKVSWRDTIRRFFQFYKQKCCSNFDLFLPLSRSLLLWGIVWYRSVRPQHKVRTAVCERFQGFVLNIAIAKSPWVQETESRGIGKRLVRQHHLLHNESLALCQQMLTCSLSESVVCSLRGSRQTNKNGIRQTPPKWR